MIAQRRELRAAVLGLCLILATAAAPGTARTQDRDDIRQAIASGTSEKAIALALEALQADPGNAEVRFLLARAYAYSGRWDEADAILSALLAEHPADADLLVFMARLLSWRGDLEGAERVFRRALDLQPRSADALAGLADLASWRGAYDAALVLCRQALDLDPDHAGALFRVGSVLLWQGNYGQARGYLARAVELEPENKDFRRGLDRAVPLFVRKPEVWLSGRNEHWSDGRADYSDLGLSVLFDVFADRAKLIIKAGRSWRADGRDDQIGLEAYPYLWKGAYGYVDLGFAPKAEFIPSTSVHLEVYQSLLERYEVSLGVRRISLPGTDVLVLTGSAAAYWGAWYPNVRAYWDDVGAGTELTWMAGLRRYFTNASYAWARIGRGSRSFETGSAEEMLAGPAWFAEAGFDVNVFRDIKLRGYVSRRDGIGGADSTALALVAGYSF